MKFVEKQCADDTLDLVCRMCPLHLLEPGERLRSEAICPHCQAMNPASANFCMGCGEKIER